MPKPPVDVEELRRGGVVALREKDMFSLWVKTACCNLNASQLRKLADITDRYARGFLLFSTRQIPIIPFIHLQDVAEAKRELSQVELELDRCGSRVRNINVCYEDKICHRAVTNCITLGERLENFFSSPLLRKVKIGVSGCHRDCVICRVLDDIGFIGVDSNGSLCYYDVYVGGRLGVNPYVGVKMAEHLPEEECVRFVQNYFDLLEHESKQEERSADLINRLGAARVRQELNRNLSGGTSLRPVECPAKRKEKEPGKTILKVKATCGEVNSNQLRRLADIAERYGYGFVHFAVWGAPEIPGVSSNHMPEVRSQLHEVGLQVLEGGVNNLQTCFGAYCAESLVDTRSLLRQIEERVERLGLDNQDIRISASGCPNSCAAAHLADIGFYGVAEPDVEPGLCEGCGLCVLVCKRNAIEMRDGLAVIDAGKCRYCGQCQAACPYEAILTKRQGFAVLAGGKEGADTRLGTVIAQFVPAEEALDLAGSCLKLIKDRNMNLADIIDIIGLEQLKDTVASKI